MPTNDIAYRIDPFPSGDDLQPVWQAAWGSTWSGDLTVILDRSLVHACAYAGRRLIGYVNVAWDGGVHAFIIDTAVHPDVRRQGIGLELLSAARDAAMERGAAWLHVDFEDHLKPLYFDACGFTPTSAGLLQLG